MSRRFLSHSAWAGAGLAVNGGSQLAVVTLLARFTDPVSLGAYGFAVAIATPVFVFSHFGQRTLMVNGADLHAPLAAHLRVRMVTGLAAFVCALAIGGILGGATVLPMLACACLARFSDSLIDARQGDFQRAERMDLAGVALVRQGLVSFVAFAAVVAWTRAAVPSVLAFALTRFGMSAFPIPGRGALAPMRPGLPLAVAAALILLCQGLPRLLIEQLAGLRSLGIFAAISSLEMAGSIVIAGAAQVAAPKLAARHRSGDEAGFRKWLLRLSGLALAVGLGCVTLGFVAGEKILSLLFGPIYSGETMAFIVLLIAAAINYLNIVLRVGVSARLLIRVQPYVQLTALAVGIPAGWWLVGRYQILGAAWTSVVIAVSQLVCLLALLRREATA